MKLLKKLLLALSIGFIGFICVFTFAFFAITANAKLSEQKLLLPETQILLYDHSDEKLSSSFSFDKRDIVRIDELPEYTKDAFVCTEDKRFYQHNGFDFVGIGRALSKNIKSRSFQEGASTISQQLIKNTHLSQEKTLRRKLKEVKLTWQLERKYSKEQILETYLNTIYFGHSCYGIASAAEFYFQKSASELTIDESAILAGLVRSPNNYSPFKHPEAAKWRRNIVLGLMLQQNKIDKSTYDFAVNAPLPTTYSQKTNRAYAHLAVEELDKILDKLGLDATGKIQLFTHFDGSAQKLLEDCQTTIDSGKTLAVIDNESHGVIAYHSSCGNVIRSPGSLIKPLLIYAPAFNEGLLTPATPILDEPTSFNGYSPKNYNHEYHGFVSTREAIASSLNVPAVKALNSLGIEKAAKYAERLGLPIPEKDRTLALGLGGMEYGYRFLDVLSAYATFANGGLYSPCNFIRKVLINGITVYKQTDDVVYCFSPETAYLTTDTLKTAAKSGTAKKLRDIPFAVAAKTGTVGTKNGNTDAYSVAYTTQHTIGCWMGNPDNSAIDTTGGDAPTSAIKGILDSLYPSTPPDDFPKPNGIKNISLDAISYYNEQKMLIADKLAPNNYKISELFDTMSAPNAISTRFSMPTISAPRADFNGREITISFPKTPPEYYHYKIIRRCKNQEETVYNGNAFSVWTDKALSDNAVYEYRIIPYYKEHEGKEIILPSIYTGQLKPPPIANTPWWNE